MTEGMEGALARYASHPRPPCFSCHPRFTANYGKMTNKVIGTSIIELNRQGLQSLKQKRSVLKGQIARLHKTFSVSCGEVALHDAWQSAAIGVAVVSTSAAHAENVLQNVVIWIEHNRPDLIVVDETLEIVPF